MNALTRAFAAGASGAVTTTVLHQLTRGLTADAPRVDLLGMQALARLLRAANMPDPTGSALYNLTLAGDLVSNSAYFALVAAVASDAAPQAGAALGVAAGLGAVYLPPFMDLSTEPTNRTTTTRAITVALYTAGGIVAGLVYRALPD